MHKVMLEDRQAPVGFSAFCEWNSGDKQGTGNRCTIGRSLERVNLSASVTLII